MDAIVEHRTFILANTEVVAPPLVPEIRLYLAHEALPIWEKTEEELGEIGLPPPFWAFAWAGGQALARYVLDNPTIVLNQRVLDLASGSGLVAIAAKTAGAVSALAADIDRFSLAAISLNARLNDVEIETTSNDLLCQPANGFDVILAGDLFYERSLAERAHAWLRKARTDGADVFIGDPGRAYLSRDALVQIATYNVPVTRELEDAEIKRSAVWTFRP